MHLCEGANEVGVLLRIATALNATAIPMMNISTYDSNYVIVPTSCCSIAGASSLHKNSYDAVSLSITHTALTLAVERCIAALNDPGPPLALAPSSASDALHRLHGSASIEYTVH